MITIPMAIETDIIEVNMSIGVDQEDVGMSIGAEYSMIQGDAYEGSYEVTPKAWEEQTLPTRNKLMENDVTVFRVPYYETSNVHDGLTVFIAEDING